MIKKTDKLDILKNADSPEPSKTRRAQNLEAAMLAFDKEQQEQLKQKNKNFQGNGLVRRLMSIFNFSKRTFIMDMRIPLGGVAIIGLVLLPLALMYNSSTSLTGLNSPLGQPVQENKDMQLSENLTKEKPAKLEGRTRSENDGAIALDSAAPVAESEVSEAAVSNPAVQMTSKIAQRPEPLGRIAPTSVMVNEQSGDRFSSEDESSLFITAQTPVSTFSIDVDTASYTYVRSQLENGLMPNLNAVRIEEMVNYFSYGYQAPTSANVPFMQSVEVYPTPWNEATKLLHIGIKGFTPELSERPKSNLVLLIDTSGSMNAPDKLPLLKRSFSLLLNQLDENDTISIVAYAGSAGVVLEPTKASEKRKILRSLERLSAGGSTAGGQGIELAYELADEAKSDGSNNRVILATDGDFNVGISSPDALKSFIEKKRDDGISLSVLGFGTGNYNDELMQALAQNGNGNAFYIDSFLEAKKVLSEEVLGTLMTIAKDVKIQVEFNPLTVAEYRLVGYETRALKREDFNNDKVDAGDIGAGHSVTAIYEITPVGSSAISVDALRYQNEKPVVDNGNKQEYAFLKLRYKLPNEDKSKLIEVPIRVDAAKDNIADISPEFRFGASVAAFAQKLRGSNYADNMSYDDIEALARGSKGEDRFGYRAEFISLVDIANSLSK